MAAPADRAGPGRAARGDRPRRSPPDPSGRLIGARCPPRPIAVFDLKHLPGAARQALSGWPKGNTCCCSTATTSPPTAGLSGCSGPTSAPPTWRSSPAKKSRLPPLPYRYLDFARWQRQLLSRRGARRRLAFWRGRLAGSAPLLLPLDFQRPEAFTYRGARHLFELDAWSRPPALRELCRGHGATLYMTLLAGLAALLHRWTGQDQLQRRHPDRRPIAA